MSKLKIGIIGAGIIAKAHLKVLKYIDDFKIVGITSRTQKKAKKLAKEFKIEKVFKNYKELIKLSNLDGVLILVSAENIFDVTKKIIPYKLPIFLEKPPGLNLKETRILSNLAHKHHVKSMVGLNRRFYSIFSQGISVIKKHGKLLGILIEGHEKFWKMKIKNNKVKKLWKKWIYANGIHVIDLFRFFGGDIKKIYALKKNCAKGNNQYSASISFKNGVIGTYISHWLSPGSWSVTLFGNKVTVKFKPLEKGYWIDKKFNKHKLNSSKEDKYLKPGFFNQMVFFRDLILNKKTKWPAQSLKDVSLTMQLIEKINK